MSFKIELSPNSVELMRIPYSSIIKWTYGSADTGFRVNLMVTVDALSTLSLSVSATDFELIQNVLQTRHVVSLDSSRRSLNLAKYPL